MTTQPAPYPYFIGIDYNNSFFASGSSGSLSQAQADARYLIKIETDSASSLETFSGGIATENIDTSSLTQDLNIGNSNNRTADIYIGAGLESFEHWVGLFPLAPSPNMERIAIWLLV